MLLMPVIVSKVDNNRDKHRESLILVGFEDVEEVIVFKEAHCSISNLQVNTTNTSNNSLEKLLNQMFDLVDFAHLKNFLKLSQEESFLNAVSEGPVSQETF